jgi:hypothetical protein
MQTIYDIAQTIRVTSPTGKVGKSAPSIVEGKTPHKAPSKTGLITLTPNQILNVRVERLSLNGVVDGYQREHTLSHCRRIAHKIQAGATIAPPTLALDGGHLYAVDGQHRCLGAVIAWKPLTVIVESLTKTQRSERFTDQRLAIRPSSDVVVLAGNDPVSKYLKDAIEAETSGVEHPLAGLVGFHSNTNHVGAGTMHQLVSSYINNNVGAGAVVRAWMQLSLSEQRSRFSTELADEFALLIRAFGPKSMAHPVIHRPGTLRALTDIAVMAVRRSPKKNEDIQRWQRRMPQFDWSGATWATRHMEIRPILTAWWNKRLPEGRKVQF